MQKYQSIISGTNGSVIRNVPVTVLKEDGSLAEIFMDREGQVQAPNPLVTDSRGVFYFYAKNGRYSLRTAADGVQITDADTVLLFDPDETASDGPIADAVRRAEDAAERAETALGDSGLQTLVQNAQNAASDASQAVADVSQAVASINTAVAQAGEAKEAAQAAAQIASNAASGAQAVKDSLLTYSGSLSATPEWSSVPAHVDLNLDAQAQALANRSELLRDNQKRTQLHFATLVEAQAAAATLPDGSNVVVDGVTQGHVSAGYYVVDGGVPALSKKDFDELRAYSGKASLFQVTEEGIAGFFRVRPGDSVSVDDGGTLIVLADGRRVERLFSGFADVRMFGAKPICDTDTDGFDSTDAIQRALNSKHSVISGGGKRYAVKACRVPSFKIVCDTDLLTLPGAVPSEFWSPMTIGAHGDQTLTESVTFENIRVNGNRLLNGVNAVGQSEDGGRHGFRVIGNARKLRFINCDAEYCGSYGFFFYRGLNTAPIPFQDIPTISDVKLINCNARWNKSHGGAADSIKDFLIEGGEYTHNGLDYQTDPGALTLGGSAYSNAWDFEGYGIGSYIGNVTVRNADLRFNAASSVLIQDPVSVAEPRFQRRTSIRLLNNLYDTGTHPLRLNPTVAISITTPYENWSGGIIYSDVQILGGSCAGHINFTNVANTVIDVKQNVSGKLGDSAYSDAVICITDNPLSFNDLFGTDITYRRAVRNDSGAKALTLGAASGSVVNGTANLTWVRLGNVMQCSLRVDITDKGSASGVAILGGLPFECLVGATSGFRHASGVGTYSVSGSDLYVWAPGDANPYVDGSGFTIGFSYITG